MNSTTIQIIFSNIKEDCLKQINESVPDKNNKTKFCELVWDGIMCWPKTEAGEELSYPCPNYYGFSPKTNVTKKCMETGKWFYHEGIKNIWTNYSQCKLLLDDNTHTVPLPISDNLALIHTWVPRIQTLKRFGYCLSVSTLLLAIIIFLSIKKLQCARNRLHLNLFISFGLKAFLTLFKEFLFVDGIVLPTDIVQDGTNKYVKEHNSWICKAISSFWQYSIQTNYFLVLMEGIYLHNLLFRTLNSNKDNINIYLILGWGLPYCFTLPWIMLKTAYDDEYCWTTQENQYLQLFVHVPIVVTTLVNFILFAKIINILLVKLNTMHIQQRRIKYRRLIRSTLILMPLFGVPHAISIITWYNASTNPTVELIWICFDQTFTSLQGFFVAFLYCLSNKDVRNEIKQQFTMKYYSDDHNKSFPLYATITNRFSFTTDNNDRQLTLN